MQLTLYTDYAIRTLVYLAMHPERVVPVSEVGRAFDISTNHLAKVAKMLTRAGLVSARRGRDGGLTLAVAPEEIRLGALVRRTEGHDLLECFDRDASTCHLTGACRIERAVREARDAFFAVLDRYTLAELVVNRPQLVQLLTRAQRKAVV